MSRSPRVRSIHLACALAALLWMTAISPARAQSRRDVIRQVLNAVDANPLQPHQDSYGGLPARSTITSLDAEPASPCGGLRLTFYTAGDSYWGDAAILDCANEATARKVLNDLPPAQMLRFLPQIMEDRNVYLTTFYGLDFASRSYTLSRDIDEACAARYRRDLEEEMEVLRNIESSCTPSEVNPCLPLQPRTRWTCGGEELWAALQYAWRSGDMVFAAVYPLGPPPVIELGQILNPDAYPTATPIPGDTLPEALYKEAVRYGLIVSGGANADPQITGLGMLPAAPTTADEVLFTVTASDPDGDPLTYIWLADGQVMYSAVTRSVTWRNPPQGSHVVTVRVSDGKGGFAERELRFEVREGTGDRDQDGISDRDDLCPDEPAPFSQDGCLDFAVDVGCEPAAPAAAEPVACRATVYGAHAGETLEILWYLDGPATGAEGTAWGWAAAQEGVHEVRVEVIGNGRTAEASAILEVGTEQALAVTIGVTPNPPVEGRDAFFTAAVRGQRAGDTLTYAWAIDGAYQSDEPAWNWTATAGAHTVTLVVRAEPGGREQTATLNVTTASAVVALRDDADAGFSLVLSCNGSVSSDETLECTAGIEPAGLAAVFQFQWWVDGMAALSEAVLDRSALALAQPAPGDHLVQVQAIDSNTGRARSGTALVAVRPGRNAPIPPLAQASAAGGTLGALGVWLWWEWLRARRAEAEEAALQTERDAWFHDELDRTKRERDARLRAEGWEYDASSDTWRPGQDHAQEVEKRLRAQLSARMDRTIEMAERLKRMLPEDEWGDVNEAVSEWMRLRGPNDPDDADLARRILELAWHRRRAELGEEGARARAEAEFWGTAQRVAEVVRDGAALLETIIFLAPAHIAITGAGVSITASQATAAAAAKLSGFYLGANFARGLGEGWSEGGLVQGLAQGTKAVLPVNTLIAVKQWSLGEDVGIVRIGLSLVQDVGNYVGLRDGLPALARAVSGSRPVRNTVDWLTGRTGDVSRWPISGDEAIPRVLPPQPAMRPQPPAPRYGEATLRARQAGAMEAQQALQRRWRDPDSVWAQARLGDSMRPEVQRTLDAFEAGRCGASVRNLDVRGRTPSELRAELTGRGFRFTDEPLQSVKRGSHGEPLYVRTDGFLTKNRDDPLVVRHWIGVNPDGGMIRIKPQGDPSSPFAHVREPNVSKSVLVDPSGGTGYNNEAFKVTNRGLAVPKDPTPGSGLSQTFPDGARSQGYIDWLMGQAHSVLWREQPGRR